LIVIEPAVLVRRSAPLVAGWSGSALPAAAVYSVALWLPTENLELPPSNGSAVTRDAGRRWPGSRRWFPADVGARHGMEVDYSTKSSAGSIGWPSFLIESCRCCERTSRPIIFRSRSSRRSAASTHTSVIFISSSYDTGSMCRRHS
jgi:hypothetical protein